MPQSSSSRFEKATSLLREKVEFLAIVEAINEIYGAHNSAFFLSNTPFTGINLPFVRTTYKEEWVSRYLQKSYGTIDPVARVASENEKPFSWDEIETSPDEDEFLLESQTFDVGRNGFSMPYRDPRGFLSMYTITSNLEGGDWRRYLHERRDEFIKIGQHLHQIALVESKCDEGYETNLTNREIEVLGFTALGKDYRDIANQLNISEHTVRGYLKSAREKLGCRSLAQAVVKAVKLKVLKM